MSDKSRDYSHQESITVGNRETRSAKPPSPRVANQHWPSGATQQLHTGHHDADVREKDNAFRDQADGFFE